MGGGEVREEGARKGSERRERRRKRGRGWWRVQENAPKGPDGGGRGRGEAAEGASGGEHCGLAGGRAEPSSRQEGLGVFGSWVLFILHLLCNPVFSHLSSCVLKAS